MTDPAYTDILYEKKGAAAWITINRPQTLNAFTGHTLTEIEDAIKRADGDRDIGVLVLTGAGDRAFSSGGDVKWEADGGLEDNPYNLHNVIRECSKPVIARVNGYAIGGGNHLAYFCDFTIASDNAIFGQNGPRVGSPASGVIVSYLIRVVGAKRAREMWMLCRRYSAQQMYEWGLVNAVAPPEKLDEEVEKWCADILSLSPTCLKILKASFNKESEHIMGHGWDIQRAVAPNYYDTGEQQEGANAFLEKRPPDFSKWR